MILEVLGAFASIFVLLFAMVIRPTTARCPDGLYVLDGIRGRELGGWGTGSFTCSRPPIGGDNDVLTGINTAQTQHGTIYGRIYCTGGALPIVIDTRTVGCSR